LSLPLNVTHYINKKVKTEDLLEIVGFALNMMEDKLNVFYDRLAWLRGCSEAETIIELLHKLSRLGKRKEINVTFHLLCQSLIPLFSLKSKWIWNIFIM
jgi:hypothetical protein